MPELTKTQRDTLLRPVNPSRVLQAQGQSHLPAFDVEAHLTRIFGFEGWDREIVELWLIHETEAEKGGRPGWTVTYGCRLRLTVRNPEGELVKVTDGCATGSANNLPSRGDAHDFAMKNADSYALKRCAKALGDQFGLSLYNKGSVKALVRSIVAYGEEAPAEYEAPKSMGNDEREQVDHEDLLRRSDPPEEFRQEYPPVAESLAVRVEQIAAGARKYIEVPFKDKDRVKALGARWDMNAKSWYAPPEIEFDVFREWFSGPSPETSALFPSEPPLEDELPENLRYPILGVNVASSAGYDHQRVRKAFSEQKAQGLLALDDAGLPWEQVK